jgi:hypothetical protein
MPNPERGTVEGVRWKRVRLTDTEVLRLQGVLIHEPTGEAETYVPLAEHEAALKLEREAREQAEAERDKYRGFYECAEEHATFWEGVAIREQAAISSAVEELERRAKAEKPTYTTDRQGWKDAAQLLRDKAEQVGGETSDGTAGVARLLDYIHRALESNVVVDWRGVLDHIATQLRSLPAQPQDGLAELLEAVDKHRAELDAHARGAVSIFQQRPRDDVDNALYNAARRIRSLQSSDQKGR